MKCIFLILSFYCINTLGQNVITFKVEKLSKPNELLRQEMYEKVYEGSKLTGTSAILGF